MRPLRLLLPCFLVLAFLQPAFSQAENRNATLAVEWNEKGVNFLESGQIHSAIQAFYKALQFKPKDEILIKNLGISYFQRGQNELEKKKYEKAIVSFRSAADTDREVGRYPLFVGYSYYLAGENWAALWELNRAIRKFPKEADAYQILGEIYYNQGQLKRAIENLEIGVQLFSSAPEGKAESPKEREIRLGKLKSLQGLLKKTKKERDIQKDFIPDSSNHFDFRYDGSRRQDLANNAYAIAADLEDAYAAVGERFGIYPRKRFQVLFYDSDDFSQTVSADAWIGGVFDGKIRIPVQDYTKEKKRIRQVIFHEYTHAVIHSIAPNCPTWLNEGLAQMEEGVNIKDTEKRLRDSRDQLLGLEELRGPFIKLGEKKARIAYDMSFSLTRKIIDRYGFYTISKILARLGKSNKPEGTIFREAVGLPLEEVFRQWREQL